MQVVYHEYFNFFNINIMAFCFHLRCSFLHGSLRNKKAVALGLLTRSLYCSHHREQLCGVYSLLTRPIFAKQSWLFCNGDLFFFFYLFIDVFILAVLALCRSGGCSLAAVCGLLVAMASISEEDRL